MIVYRKESHCICERLYMGKMLGTVTSENLKLHITYAFHFVLHVTYTFDVAYVFDIVYILHSI